MEYTRQFSDYAWTQIGNKRVALHDHCTIEGNWEKTKFVSSVKSTGEPGIEPGAS